jgi:hypothetical protein
MRWMRYLVSPSLARRIAITTQDRGKLLRLGRYLTRCPILNLCMLKLSLRQIPEIRPAPARRLADHLTDPLRGILVEQDQPALARGLPKQVAQFSHLRAVSVGHVWLLVCHIDAARGRSFLDSPYTLVETLRRIIWDVAG